MLFVLVCTGVWAVCTQFGGQPAERRDVRVLHEPVTYLNRRVSGLEEAPDLNASMGVLPEGRYRYYWKLDRSDFPDLRPSVLFTNAGGPTYVMVNGAELSVSQSGGLSLPGFGQHWQIAEIRPNLLVPGQNRIELVTDHGQFQAGLQQIHIGPWTEMSRRADRWLFWISWMPRLALFMAALGMVAALAGLLLQPKRSTAMTFWAGMSVLLVFHITNALWGGGALGVSTAVIVGFVGPVVMGGLMALRAYRLRLFQSDRKLDRLLSGGGVAGCFLLVLNGIMPVVPGLAPVVLSLCWFGVGGIILTETGQALLRLILERRSRVQVLARKVQEQALELDEKSRQVAYEMRNRAILEERQRFTRDIHDGIGGQLLSLLLRIRSGALDHGRISEEVQASLNDLRLVVDSIDHLGDDLDAALYTFRVRAEPQMRAAGIDFHWQQPDALQGSLSGTGATLHLYRMIQEGLSNAIRHARASRVQVRIEQPDDASLIVSVIDDGDGMSATELGTPGKGIRNLKSRAKLLKADVCLAPGPGGVGTRLTITAPLGGLENQRSIQPM